MLLNLFLFIFAFVFLFFPSTKPSFRFRSLSFWFSTLLQALWRNPNQRFAQTFRTRQRILEREREILRCAKWVLEAPNSRKRSAISFPKASGTTDWKILATLAIVTAFCRFNFFFLIRILIRIIFRDSVEKLLIVWFR